MRRAYARRIRFRSIAGIGCCLFPLMPVAKVAIFYDQLRVIGTDRACQSQLVQGTLALEVLMSKSLIVTAGLLVALMLAPPVLAADPAPAPTQAASAENDPLVCKRQEETGTRLKKKKICKTESEWEAQEQAAQKWAKDMNRSGAGQPGGESLIGN
jgi:hypothetical protein